MEHLYYPYLGIPYHGPHFTYHQPVQVRQSAQVQPVQHPLPPQAAFSPSQSIGIRRTAPLPGPPPPPAPAPGPAPTSPPDSEIEPEDEGDPEYCPSAQAQGTRTRASRSKAKARGSGKSKAKGKAPAKPGRRRVPPPPRPTTSSTPRPAVLTSLSTNVLPEAPHLPFPPSPSKAPIFLKDHRGSLLPAPPGALLDVNDLLIVHPPTLPLGAHPIMVAGQLEGSTNEMYTCRVCAKTYDGKNARSVARRHLQDKHDVPLSCQPRRSRWDGDRPEPSDLGRPRTVQEARDRILKAKRDWAKQHRTEKRQRIRSAFSTPDENAPNHEANPSTSISATPLHTRAATRGAGRQQHTQTPVSNARGDAYGDDGTPADEICSTLQALPADSFPPWSQATRPNDAVYYAGFTPLDLPHYGLDFQFDDEEPAVAPFDAGTELPSSPPAPQPASATHSLAQWSATWQPVPPEWALELVHGLHPPAIAADDVLEEISRDQHLLKTLAGVAVDGISTEEQDQVDRDREAEKAAESLLNLHSTPLRPSPTASPTRPGRFQAQHHSQGQGGEAHVSALGSPAPIASRSSRAHPQPQYQQVQPLARARPARTLSLAAGSIGVQFAGRKAARQGMGSRSMSLSFARPSPSVELDDPFTFAPVDVDASVHTSNEGPKMLQDGEGGETEMETSSPVLGRVPLDPIGNNLGSAVGSQPFVSTAYEHSSQLDATLSLLPPAPLSSPHKLSSPFKLNLSPARSHSRFTPFKLPSFASSSSAPQRLAAHGVLSAGAISEDSTAATVTPYVARRAPPPSSLSKSWTLSSPANAETATALGLGLGGYYAPPSPWDCIVRAETPRTGRCERRIEE